MTSLESKRTTHRNQLRRVLARNVEIHRTRLGLSAEVLSLKCGLAYSYVGRLERGTPRANPTLDTLEELARTLGITVVELLTPSPPENE
jgi:transcriptional regulator with XRE-family HTH domain